MQSSSIPVKIPVTWAASAPGGDVTYPMPVPSQISITPGRASFTDGFPPDNFLPPAGGGVPPFGQDFNGIISQITRWVQWQNAGAPIPYDATFQSAVGGYPKGAMLNQATLVNFHWISLVDNNLTNPDAGGANWYDTSKQPVGGVLTGTLPNPGMAAGAAAANVGALGGSLVGTLPDPTLNDTGITPGTYLRTAINVQADGRINGIVNGAYPTYQDLTTGSSATFTTPGGAKRLKFRMTGGGGAGALAPSTAGGNGGTTSFGSTTALGGSGGSAGLGGAGGTGGTTGTGSQIMRRGGGPGQGGTAYNEQGASSVTIAGGAGGNGPFGGAGTGNFNTAVNPASPNTGAGGAGSIYVSSGVGTFVGMGGGGAGEYVEFVINNPLASYVYTVGPGGAASGTAGAGSAGSIEVEIDYD